MLQLNPLWTVPVTLVREVLGGGLGASHLSGGLVLQLVEVLESDAALDAAHREALTERRERKEKDKQ
jgi:hypothetical protein